MHSVTSQTLIGQLSIADELRIGRAVMFEPQDLPGRYGRAIAAFDRVLNATGSIALVGGGWAVWRHGYVGRVTQDVDVLVPASDLPELLGVAAVSGFEVLSPPAGRGPKLRHRETGVEVDLLPEGERPGTPAHPAPTVLPHPAVLGGRAGPLRYLALPGLIQLKLGAGRARDESDVVELVRANPLAIDSIRAHLAAVHPDYATAFDRLVERARDQQDQ